MLKLTPPILKPSLLSNKDLQEAAKRLRCDVAGIKAVIEVETGGKGGFLPDGRPRILFEAHYFARLTGHKYNQSNPTISSRVWNRRLYIGGAPEYSRLQEACSLDQDAALRSASWGMFQIMGDNCKLCGVANTELFVKAMMSSENKQLDLFCTFILNRKLDDEIRDRRWVDFARSYNGAQYHVNRYDEKLANAYERHRKAIVV